MGRTLEGLGSGATEECGFDRHEVDQQDFACVV